jgi:hypothetical protein
LGAGTHLRILDRSGCYRLGLLFELPARGTASCSSHWADVDLVARTIGTTD